VEAVGVRDVGGAADGRPLWAGYTLRQKGRAFRHAATYISARLRSLYLREGGTGIPREVVQALPYEVRLYHMQLTAARIDLSRRCAMVAAYLASHPDDEVAPAELRQLTGLAETPFF
jgi:hypothetical protein